MGYRIWYWKRYQKEKVVGLSILLFDPEASLIHSSEYQSIEEASGSIAGSLCFVSIGTKAYYWTYINWIVLYQSDSSLELSDGCWCVDLPIYWYCNLAIDSTVLYVKRVVGTLWGTRTKNCKKKWTTIVGHWRRRIGTLKISIQTGSNVQIASSK